MNNLQTVVSAWIEEQREDGYNDCIDDLLQYGCQSGIVGELVYYVDTVAFYEAHRQEIAQLLAEILSDTGLTVDKIFADWDAADPLALDTHNQNLLAWFGFEETARRMYGDE